MAGRDINIPFGPDRTGALDLSSIVPEVDPSSKEDGEDLGHTDRFEAVGARTNVSEEEINGAYNRAFADVAPVGVTDSEAEPEPGAQGDAGLEVSGAAISEIDGAESAAAEFEGDATGAGFEVETEGDAEGNPAGNAVADVQASLVALKDSIDQGRQLKAREKERDEFGQRLDEARKELADREDILANYREIVAEQDTIIDENTRQREARKNELAQLVADQEQISEELQRMREYNDSRLEPLETALGRAKATAEQAKNDERSRKSELSAAESEKRRAEGGDDAAMATARFEVAQQAFDEAAARSQAAKEALDRAQKQYDDLREQVEQAEAPLERSLEDLDKQIEELKESITRLGDTISAANKRRQYCDTVYQYPDETAKLRESVEADEEIARRMDVENDELRDRLAESKARSKTAKLVIGAVIAIIVVIIIVFFVVAGR